MSKYRYFSIHEMADLTDIFKGYNTVFKKDGKSYTIGLQTIKEIHFKFYTVKILLLDLHEKTADADYVRTDTYATVLTVLKNSLDGADAFEIKALVDNQMYDLCFTGADNANKEIYINIKN